MGRDVADFPDITLVHPPYSLPGGGPDYDLPAGWDWSPTANSKFVGDFDGDGKTDVVARIVSQADRVSGLAIYLAMHRDAKGRYSHPIVIRDDVIVKLAGR